MEEIAEDPDAPSLEEQEKLDAAIDEVNQQYSKAIDEYVLSRTGQIEQELQIKELEELIPEAQEATIQLLVIQFFLTRVLDEKIWRATYEDDKFKKHGFSSYEEFSKTDNSIKQQLRNTYTALEINPDTIKN